MVEDIIESTKNFIFNTSPIDLFFFTLLIFSVIQCYINGFISSLLSASKWLLSYVFTLYLFPIIKPYVSDFSKNEYVLDVILGVSLFFLILFIILMINKGLKKAIKLSSLGKIDKIFGFFFGILRTYVVCICIFSTINNFFDYKDWPIDTDESITFSLIERGSSFLSDEIPNEDEYQNAKDKIQEL
ncbi:CvpA family protein [Candidatus Pelagibacter sp.]|uniref:CvpA family protein n=1 Tax=Candidatus Pelagibacter sp. TaxID=2024849 RepID=UPI003F840E0C